MAQDAPRQMVPGRVELGLARLRLAPRLDVLPREPAYRVARHGAAAPLRNAACVRARLLRPLLRPVALVLLGQELVEPGIHPRAALEQVLPGIPVARRERLVQAGGERIVVLGGGVPAEHEVVQLGLLQGAHLLVVEAEHPAAVREARREHRIAVAEGGDAGLARGVRLGPGLERHAAPQVHDQLVPRERRGSVDDPARPRTPLAHAGQGVALDHPAPARRTRRRETQYQPAVGDRRHARTGVLARGRLRRVREAVGQRPVQVHAGRERPRRLLERLAAEQAAQARPPLGERGEIHREIDRRTCRADRERLDVHRHEQAGTGEISRHRHLRARS